MVTKEEADMPLNLLSKRQLNNALIYTEDIINNLSDKALNDLLSGYDNDQNRLFEELLVQTSNIINFNSSSINSEKIEFLADLEKSFDEQLKRVSYNYFKTTCLPNFHQGWRNLEWGNMIQLYPYLVILASRSHGKSYESCYSFPLWRMYTYNKPNFYDKDTVDNKNRKETLLITNTSTLGSEHIDKVVEEIRFNDLLAEKLNPYNKANLGSTGITTETGAKLHLRGIGGFFRGLHCGSVVGDDMPDESSIYSQEQRDKLKSKFYGGITPIVEPFGHCLITGTPYSERDIYYDLKTDSRFTVLEYPAVFPNGTLLSPDRFTFDKLTEEKESLGSLVFSREYLVVPVSDDATIFPYDILMRSTIGMENIDLVDNIDSFPIKLVRTTVGCDFAKSANVGADYTVYTVWGADSMDNYYLLHVYRKRGATHNEQISQIVSLDQRFRPNSIRVESNGFQGMLADMARERGIRNIEEFVTTGANKKNWYDGLPSLAALFERGQIKIPYRSGPTKEMADTIFQEFNSVSFRPDKGTLESTSGHDDTCLSSYFGITELREHKNVFKAYMV